MEDFAEIEQLLNETRIASKADNKTYSLWSFLDGRESINSQGKLPEGSF